MPKVLRVTGGLYAAALVVGGVSIVAHWVGVGRTSAFIFGLAAVLVGGVVYTNRDGSAESLVLLDQRIRRTRWGRNWGQPFGGWTVRRTQILGGFIACVGPLVSIAAIVDQSH